MQNKWSPHRLFFMHPTQWASTSALGFSRANLRLLGGAPVVGPCHQDVTQQLQQVETLAKNLENT
jgi:hypothetical protein